MIDYTIHTNQQGIHQRLGELVVKHQKTLYRKPIADHSQRAFAQLVMRVDGAQPIMLDLGCGRAASTIYLSQQYPDHWVIGVDKSAQRLEHMAATKLPPNCHLVRCDAVDFLLLAQQAHWRFAKTWLLYPNPWPKAEHLQRRWQGHPIFSVLMALSDQLEARSNWLLYLEELQLALRYYQRAASLHELTVTRPLTAFERKYQQAGVPVYQLLT